MENSEYSFVYSNEMYTNNIDSINYNDVVYFVSDIWNKNRYIYASDKTVFGNIASFTTVTTKNNATAIAIGSISYTLSQYFDKTKLDSYYTGSFIKLILGEDGEVVDIY